MRGIWLVALAMGLAGAVSASAQTYTQLWGFSGGADGSLPENNVVLDAAGNLYGETHWGGFDCPLAAGNFWPGCGVLFKLSPAGELTPLVTFNQTNGAFSFGDVLLAGNTLFGSTVQNAADNGGLIFSVHTDGSDYRILHVFDGADGATPQDKIVLAPQQVIYGVTRSGGPYEPVGQGVLYRLTPDGTYTVLHYFTGHNDGQYPDGIVLERSGMIIGSTQFGGAHGAGVIYAYKIATGTFVTLYAFTGYHDGGQPRLGTMGADGTIYGVTEGGGGTGGYGTLFALESGGHLRTLWRFTGGVDGGRPNAPPVLGAHGALIGTTTVGPGVTGYGTLYSYASGVLTTLHSFDYNPNQEGYPAYPYGAPAVSTSGSIYGTTEFGDTNLCVLNGVPYTSGCGTIYRYSP
jgi:uncharacterized repeat protein (TIGR03803 family)